MNVSLITFPAPDPDATKRFFRELTGIDPYADAPQYVGYKDGEMEIGLVPKPRAAWSYKRLETSATDCWSPASKTRTARS